MATDYLSKIGFIELTARGALAEPTKIRVRTKPGEKYPTIIAYELGENPDMREAREEWDDSELPF